jgi:flagellar biosynthetic protein FliR
VQVSIAAPLLVSFVLATVRAAAWLMVAPPFGTRAIPTSVKAVLAFALALPVAPRLKVDVNGLTTGDLIGSVVLQVFTGTALGFVTYLLFAAVQAAGDLIDVQGGFTLAAAYDPLSSTQNSVFGKLTSQLGTLLLFALNGHLLLLRGFEASYDVIPLDGSIGLERLSRVITAGVGEFFVSALEIAGPLLGVLFIVDVGLGLLARIAPALNVFSLMFPAKILATLLLFALVIPLFGPAVEHLVSSGGDAVATLLHGSASGASGGPGGPGG